MVTFVHNYLIMFNTFAWWICALSWSRIDLPLAYVCSCVCLYMMLAIYMHV